MYRNRNKKLKDFEHTESYCRSICHGQKIVKSKVWITRARKMHAAHFGVKLHFFNSAFSITVLFPSGFRFHKRLFPGH